MINQLSLEYFKCFENIKIDLKNLNILSGENASGKSSLIQAFLTLNQTMQTNEWSKKLILNGNNVKLGTVSDVIDKVNGRNIINISVSDEENEIGWTFSGERAQLSMQID
ncbi:TPA: AAA family ATPase, partial [Enterobacter hormaechei subsp. xiangfangensis]|nr:AAA family ATPase [Enterobacter hormaechei subsp. xiangfangensis]